MRKKKKKSTRKFLRAPKGSSHLGYIRSHQFFESQASHLEPPTARVSSRCSVPPRGIITLVSSSWSFFSSFFVCLERSEWSPGVSSTRIRQRKRNSQSASNSKPVTGDRSTRSQRRPQPPRPFPVADLGRLFVQRAGSLPPYLFSFCCRSPPFHLTRGKGHGGSSAPLSPWSALNDVGAPGNEIEKKRKREPSWEKDAMKERGKYRPPPQRRSWRCRSPPGCSLGN